MIPFSIIIGTYNQSKVIGDLAEALGRQTIQGFEIHLCDDGSTDGTREAFEAKLNPLLKKNYHYHRQENKGMRLAKNVNQGIKAAQGEYCVFIMGDSFPDEHYLEVLNQFVRPTRVLCGVRYQIDNGVGVDVDYRLKKKVIPPENVMLPNRPFNMLTGNGLCIPTQALREHGGWDEELEGYGAEDTEVVARLYYKGYVCYSLVDAKLFHHFHIGKDSENIALVTKKVTAYAGHNSW